MIIKIRLLMRILILTLLMMIMISKALIEDDVDENIVDYVNEI